MIAVRFPGTFVCLRCRLQGASALQSRPFLRVPPISISKPTSLVLRRRLGTDSAEVREEPEEEPEIEWGKLQSVAAIDTETILRELGTEESSDVRELLKKDPLARRVFQVRGEKILSGTEGIPIDVLGQAAHAIILRRGGKWEHKGRQAIEQSPQAIQQVDIAATLERQNADPDLAEILKNIHELQPLKARVLPDVEFKALQLVLARGFTKEQLRSYIHYTRTAVDFEKGSRPPWILHQSLWKPKRPEGEPIDSSPDALQAMITGIASRDHKITCKALLRQLRARMGDGVIDSIDDTHIYFYAHDGRRKDASILGLKDRLSRAKKELVSR